MQLKIFGLKTLKKIYKKKQVRNFIIFLVFALVGNKDDLYSEEEVSYKEGLELSKEINAPLMFKLPQKGPSPIKGETKKEKEYLELIKQYEKYLKNNFIDAICCHNANTRLTTMINKEHQHIFELKYNIEVF